jgi:hypothetical protein
MAIQKLGPVASTSTSNTSYIQIPANLYYTTPLTCKVGTYSCAITVASKTAKIQFLDANKAVITTASLDGLTGVTVNLATEAKYVRAYQPWLQSLTSNITVSIEFKGPQLTTATYSGTVTTVTSTQSVTINGTAYVVLVGGGGCGWAGTNGNGEMRGGSGGGSGTVAEKFATNWSGTYAITIGAGGTTYGGGYSDPIDNPAGGTTSIAQGGTNIFTAGGGTSGNRNWFGDGQGGKSKAATGSFDHSGGARGGFGRDCGPEKMDPYGSVYQHAKSMIVQGGHGGQPSQTTPTNYGNGQAGVNTINSGLASGYGNGGGGSNTDGYSVAYGAPGVAYIITDVQEA